MQRRPMPPAIAAGYEPHVDGLERGELIVTRCNGCGRSQWPPRPICPRCQGNSFSGFRVEPIGEVYTFTVVHRAFHPWFASHVPYAVAIVEILEGIRLAGFYDGPLETLRCGLGVEGRVEERGGSPALVWSVEKSDA